MNYFLKLEYDGSKYLGYATQKHQKTIQDILELSLNKLNSGIKVKTFASSRTDTGVHAKSQYVQFGLLDNWDCSELKHRLNRLLPKSIAVKSVKIRPNNFNVRYDVVSKTYRYVMIREKNAFLENYATLIPNNVNLEKMQKAIPIFLGTHDFTAFCGAGSHVKNKVRTIFDFTIFTSRLAGGEVLVAELSGDGFLYNMIRIMMGTVLNVGLGKLDCNTVQKSLDSGERHSLCVTAPAQGLYLEKIKFKDKKNLPEVEEK